MNSKYPTALDKDNMPNAEWVKQRTIELYSFLPQAQLREDMTKQEADAEIERALAERYSRTDIRDEVFELNYAFFGYVASHTFINNTSISYEDKFQSACFHFCEMWHKYKFAAKYRTDLSFAVFFKPRIGECIERELNEVKYSLRRSLCMEVGDQLGKHWGQVKYEDLSDPRLKLSADKMQSLQAAFGSMYWADLDTHALFIESTDKLTKAEQFYQDNYDDIHTMLMNEMCEKERKLTDKDLLDLSLMLDISFYDLKDELPAAEAHLYRKLEEIIAIQDSY